MSDLRLMKVRIVATTGQSYAEQESRFGPPGNRDYWEGQEQAYSSIIDLVDQLLAEESESNE